MCACVRVCVFQAFLFLFLLFPLFFAFLSLPQDLPVWETVAVGQIVQFG